MGGTALAIVSPVRAVMAATVGGAAAQNKGGKRRPECRVMTSHSLFPLHERVARVDVSGVQGLVWVRTAPLFAPAASNWHTRGMMLSIDSLCWAAPIFAASLGMP